MNESTKINDILKNSLFKGIGQFLFPTDFYSITNNMTLKDVDHLLPYHSHIEVSTTIEVLEYLENQRKQGNQIFYDIYTEKEKQMVAHHEAGHVVLGLKLDDANDVQKVTIIP